MFLVQLLKERQDRFRVFAEVGSMKLRLLFAAFVFFVASLSARAQCTAFTPNVNFGLPVIGSTSGWGGCIDTNFTMLDGLLGGVTALTQNSATPSVTGKTNWLTNNTVPTVITNFLGGFPGQMINVLC